MVKYYEEQKIIGIKQMPNRCPSCGRFLKHRSFGCEGCHTLIRCNIDMPALMKLETNDDTLIRLLLIKNLSIRKLTKILDLSYPAVQNMVDDVTRKVRKYSPELEGV